MQLVTAFAVIVGTSAAFASMPTLTRIAARLDEQPVITVFVTVAPTDSGFVDPGDEHLGDSVRDLVNDIKVAEGESRREVNNPKPLAVRLAVADQLEKADVIVEVVHRRKVRTGGHTVIGTAIVPTSALVVEARIIVASYTSPIVSRHALTWTGAAQNLERQLRDWISKNRESIVSARSTKGVR
jgi:hypothetical protein